MEHMIHRLQLDFKLHVLKTKQNVCSNDMARMFPGLGLLCWKESRSLCIICLRSLQDGKQDQRQVTALSF